MDRTSFSSNSDGWICIFFTCAHNDDDDDDDDGGFLYIRENSTTGVGLAGDLGSFRFFLLCTIFCSIPFTVAFEVLLGVSCTVLQERLRRRMK